jgi:DNA-binding IclR family transcriptional regulator
MNISEIARRTGLSYTSTRRHLQMLEQSRLVEEKNYGRIRIFSVREGDEKCQAVARLFEAWPPDKPRRK